jgi:hypothetical protein
MKFHRECLLLGSVPGKAKLAFAALRASPAVISMIGPSLKKKKTLKAPQNRRFYFEDRVPHLWPS